MQIEFYKMHGLGNDFMVFDGVRQSIQFDTKTIISLADRHIGVGFDQLLLIEASPDAKADFLYRIFNSDGQEVEQCGNGARCAARFVRLVGLTEKTSVIFMTKNGLLQTKCLSEEEVSAKLGIPIIENELEIAIDANTTVRGTCISLGNPHFVIITEQDLGSKVDFIGKTLNNNSEIFPKGVNVGFLTIQSRDKAKLRVYERGVGETLACGSGACAAMAAGVKHNLLDKTAHFSLRGGHLTLNWPGVDSAIEMTGPAEFVYSGRIEINS